MSELESAYRAWRTAQIPRGADDERLAELNGDLRVADTWVAEDLVPFVESGQVFASAFEVMPRLRALHGRALRLAEDLHGADETRAIACANYLQLLVDVYAAYLVRVAGVN